MDIRRTLIIMALAMTSYFLFLTWQQDYGQSSQTATASANANVLSATSVSDMPQAPVSSELPATTTPVSVKQAESGKRVHVRTDVLDLDIDLIGGDIVRLALPAYKTAVNGGEGFTLLHDRNGQYLAQSGLVRAGQGAEDLQGLDDRASGRPQYTTAASDVRLLDGEQHVDVVLTTVADGLTVRKVFTFTRGDYRIKVRHEVENGADRSWSGALFGQIKRDSSPDPSASNHSLGMVTFLGGAWWTPEKSYNKVALGEFAKTPVNANVEGGWVAMVQHYFVTAWVPEPGQKNTLSTRAGTDGRDSIIGFVGQPFTVAPGQRGHVDATYYAGPKIQDNLKALSPGLELTVDYGWLWPIAQFLFWLLKTIHGFIGNWGWSIVLLTVLVKGAFFHLSATSYRSMANMRRVMPEMQRMKEQYGDDRAKLSQAMMELYKKEKINPLGGCLPILVQMPVFIALYWTLMESVELRHADWILWIKDLSVMDPYFVLPLLMGVTMYVQQSLNPAPQDPMQAKVLKFMPLIFTVFFLWFPAGLVLYWLVNNLLSIAQQWVITRQIEQASAK